MKILKKLSVFIAVLILAATTLTGCGGGGDRGSGDPPTADGKKGDIKVMLLVNSGSDVYYEDLFDRLGKELGIKIDYTGYAYQDYDTQLRLAMQDKVPDIFYMRPNQLKTFLGDDLLADMTQYIEDNVDCSDLLDNFNQAFRYDGVTVGSETGKIYAVNGGYSYQGLAYNKAILEKCKPELAKYGLKAPDELETGETYTWEEFAEVLLTINGLKVGGAFGSTSVKAMNMPAGLMLMQTMMNFGGSVLNSETGTVTVQSDPAVAECLEWLKSGVDEGYIDKQASFPQWSGQTLAFYTETGSWEMAPYGTVAGESSSLQDVNVDFMPWPTKTGKYEDSRAYIGGAGFAVYKYAKNIGSAAEVAAYLMNPDVLNDMCYKGMSLPMTKSLAGGEYLTDDKFHPGSKQYLTDIVSGTLGEFSPLNNCYSQEWYDVFTRGIDAVWNNAKTISTYLSEIRPVMQAHYNEDNK